MMWSSDLNVELDRLYPGWRTERPNDMAKRALVTALQMMGDGKAP